MGCLQDLPCTYCKRVARNCSPEVRRQPVGPSCDLPVVVPSGMGRLQCFAFSGYVQRRRRSEVRIDVFSVGAPDRDTGLLLLICTSHCFKAKRLRIIVVQQAFPPVMRPSENVICDRMLRGRGPARHAFSRPEQTTPPRCKPSARHSGEQKTLSLQTHQAQGR